MTFIDFLLNFGLSKNVDENSKNQAIRVCTVFLLILDYLNIVFPDQCLAIYILYWWHLNKNQLTCKFGKLLRSSEEVRMQKRQQFYGNALDAFQCAVAEVKGQIP